MEPHIPITDQAKRKILVTKLVLIGVLLLCLVYAGLHAKNFYNEIFDSDLEVTDTYRDIFPAKSAKKLKSSYTFFNGNPMPIATFTDQDKSYKLFVYKLDIHSDQKIDSLVRLISTQPKQVDSAGDYTATTTRGYKLSNQKLPPAGLKNLRFFLGGERIKQLVKNDTLLSYGIDLQQLKLYDNKSKLLAYIERQNEKSLIYYSEVLFYKRKDGIYVVYKIMRIPGDEPEDDELYRLFTNP